MSQQPQSRNQIESAIIAKAQTDSNFRKALLSNPKATLEQELGVRLPAGVELKVVEETSNTNYLVLPASVDGELSDAELETVAGGWAGLVNQAAKEMRGRLVDDIGDVTYTPARSKTQSADKAAQRLRDLL